MSRYVRPSGDAPEYTDALKAQVERLTSELAHMQTMQKVDQRVFEKLKETQDLAEHWAILAEQRRVELGECRKAIKDFIDYQDAGGNEEPPYLFWDEKVEAMRAAMEAKP